MADLRALVAGIYEAFQRGDVGHILGLLAPEVQWEQWPDNAAQRAGVEWMQPRTGRDAVLGFFQLMGTYQFKEFTVGAIMVGEDRAVGQVTCEFALPNGTTFRDEEMHLFTFNNDGQVTSFRHYLDTAKAVATRA